MLGGPCGGGLPGSKGCFDYEQVCVGESAGTPGTCLLAPDAGPVPFATELQVPGGPCDTGIDPLRDGGLSYSTTVCPWNYMCSASPISAPTGVCVPGTCVLGDGTPPPSGASFIIDGDGPTQSFVYGSGYPTIQAQLTGEASATQVTVPDGGGSTLVVAAYRDPSGDSAYGVLQLVLPASQVGHVEGSITADYTPTTDPSSDTQQDYGSAGMGAVTEVTLTEVDHTHVRGTFDLVLPNLLPSDDTKHITGSFDVCRLPNYQGQ
jgi:hypothetical protein